MSKRSGFAVKITAFIEADPNKMDTMALAYQKVSAILSSYENAGFIGIKDKVQFHLSKDIPDAPSPLDIPTALRRA